MSYPVTGGDLVPSPDLPALETRVQEFWAADSTFQASIDQREGAEQFVFNDGPPFANGLPHYGHLLTGYVKDIVPRYQTMIGKQVARRFGWDCHGLPAELEAMRELDISTTDEIEEMGIAAFNDACRTSVLRYTDEWEDYVTRQARWVDFADDYKTLDIGYMESVMWAFKTLHDKGLIYEGYKVLPYCWNDQTPLSNHELRMDDDVYQDRQDNTVTVSFPLTGEKAETMGLVGVRALAWTTTPWTLPTNAALAVSPTATYLVVPEGPNGATDTHDGAAAGGRYLLAADLVGSYAKELGWDGGEAAAAAATDRFVGSDLERLRYVPLFDYYTDTETYGTENNWQILVADYVTTTDGTGLVHQSPAYGEDDAEICGRYGIPTTVSVDDGARFLPAVRDFVGLQVFDANKPITASLRERGRLLQQKSFVHSYPHCWRCRQPLIYKAVSSWFVKVTDFRDRMVELNQDITWIPENVKDGQFGKWLENARDWSISRNRYWGSPIPVWKSDDPEYPRVDVYGSLDELERDFGVRPTDLHRPAIDDLTRPNPDDPTGRSMMVRTEEVLDCWFESGSMPFAQYHYPFENVELCESRYPADFIVEYIGQTRGWFYTMHVMATALFDRPAFTNVICHGVVLGDDGRKMSKSLRNYPDVSAVYRDYGADAMRWFLMDSPILRGGNLVVTEQAIRDTVRRSLLPLWNVWYFFGLYANAAGPKDADGRPAGYRARPRHDSDDVLDRYLLAKTHDVIGQVRDAMDRFEISEATAAISTYLDTLTNWYVRRSRDRFWEGDEQALDVLFTCFEAFLRVAAPFLPLTVEEIWKGLTGQRSVHLTDFPDASLFPADPALVAGMDGARQVVSTALGLRKTNRLRNRLPLASLTAVVADPAALRPFAPIVADELNVKDVRVLDTASPEADRLGVVPRLTVNARAAGPRLGKQVQHVIRGAKAGLWEQREDGGVVVDGLELVNGEYDLALVADPTAEGADSQAIGMLTSGAFVVLDLTVTDALEAEGTARDIVRAVQQTRKDSGLDVSDRIVLSVTGDETALAAVRAHQELVAAEVLAVAVTVGDGHAGAATSDASVGTAGLPVTVGVRRSQ